MRTFKKNVLSTLAIGSAALIALTGCGGSDNGSSDTEAVDSLPAPLDS
ncbi:hypothetical protein [Arthrobacter sp. JCM 19049]|nr:hypothetical protein [Arthrobacter sp. JCM 19049]